MSPLRIGRGGLESSPRPAELGRLKRRFARTGCLKLPGFLSPPLLALLRRGLRKAPYVTVQRPSGPERAVVAHWTLDLLAFLLNDPALLRVVEGLASSGRVGLCTSRKLYRLDGGVPSLKGWHRDLGPGRRAVLSVNLSPRPSPGGGIQSRRIDSARVLDEVRTDPGDAALISADPRFAHQVTDVRGRGFRLAFGISFQAGTPYRRLARPLGGFLPFPGRFRPPAGAACWRDGRRLLLLDAAGGAVHLGELDEARGRFRELELPATGLARPGIG